MTPLATSAPVHEPSSQLVDVVERALVAHLDLLPRPTWQRQIPNAVDSACASLGLDRAALLRQLPGDAALAEVVAGYLMVGETYFFRHPEHFHTALGFLRRAAEKSPQRRLRVWCAGCASGEEPYSLALLLVHALLPEAEGRIEILGTDRDPAAIEAAEAASYSPWSFRQPAPDWASRFFAPAAAPGKVTLPQLLRRRVTFRCEPISRTAAKNPPSSFDLIFFRNVGIYLGDASRERIFRDFAHLLRPDGRLVVAPGDPRPSRVHFRRLDDDASTCWYRTFGDDEPRQLQALLHAAAERPPRVPGPDSLPAASKRPTSEHPGASTSPSSKPATSESAGTAAPLPAAPADSGSARNALDLARQMADSGQLDQAIRLLGDEAGHGVEALRLRGCLLLAADRHDEALADLRSVLYQRPDDRLCRYFLALVMLRLGLDLRATNHLRTLRSTLVAAPSGERLEDDTTTARELLEAVDQRLGEVR